MLITLLQLIYTSESTLSLFFLETCLSNTNHRSEHFILPSPLLRHWTLMRYFQKLTRNLFKKKKSLYVTLKKIQTSSSSPPSIHEKIQTKPTLCDYFSSKTHYVFSQNENHDLRGVLMSVDIAPVLLRKSSPPPITLGNMTL